MKKSELMEKLYAAISRMSQDRETFGHEEHEALKETLLDLEMTTEEWRWLTNRVGK